MERERVRKREGGGRVEGRKRERERTFIGIWRSLSEEGKKSAKHGQQTAYGQGCL